MQKISDFLNKHKKIFLGIILLSAMLIIMGYFFVTIERNSEQSRHQHNIFDAGNKNFSTGILNPDTVLNQEFSLPEGEYDSFEIEFATFNRENNGTVAIELYGDDLIQKWVINSAELSDNSYKKFALDNIIKINTSDKFTVRITSNTLSSGYSPTVYTTSNTNNDSKLLVNGKLVNETVNLRFCSGNFTNVLTFILVVFVLFIIALGLIFYLYQFTNISTEKLALITVAIFGIFYSVVFTPTAVPDEKVHYVSAYGYSNNLMFDFRNNEKGLYMRNEDAEFLEESSTAVRVDVTDKLINDFTFFAHAEKGETFVKSPPIRDKFFAYFPSAVGITIGRILHLGGYTTYYLGRFFNLGFLVFLLWITMKLMPFGKAVFPMISLMPMSLHLAGSYSYDVYTIGMIMVLVAQILNLIYVKEKIGLKEIIITTVIAGLAIPYKVTYFAVAGLALLIPKEKFKTNKTRWISVLTIMLIGFAIIAAQQIPSRIYMFTHPTNVTYEETSRYTLVYLLSHPKRFLYLMLNTMHTQVTWYFTSMIGSHLSWLNVSIPVFYTIVFAVIVLLSFIKVEGEQKSFDFSSKLYISFLVFVSVMFLLFIFVLIHTPVTYNSIQGVQGRYLIPLLPLVYLFVRSENIVMKKSIHKSLLFYSGYFNTIVLMYVFLHSVY